ncbi:MAG: ABC transporter permease [Gammaproteobacteria bacterium]|nr:ABC transporter permease [Gammaproteobacteria bacterium]
MSKAQAQAQHAGFMTGTTRLSGASRVHKQRWLEFKRPISRRETIALGVAIWVIFFALWEIAVALAWVNAIFTPPPHTVLAGLYKMFVADAFVVDIGISVYRIAVSFAAACLVAVPLGILMGSFRRIEAFVNPLVSAWRYLPAPAFIPLLLMWFGTGDGQKIALLFIGVLWFLITLIMDHVKAVRTELIETSMTLGGNRWQILRTVVIPASMPHIVVAMRQILAVSWTYLVIAEIVAATTGIGAVMMRAKRFLHVDKIMASIIVIGILGLLFDFLFRLAHRLLFPYLYGREH